MQNQFYFSPILHWSFLGILILFSVAPCMAQELRFEEDHDRIKLFDGERHVFSYQKKTVSQNGAYPRANYIHPLYDLKGNVITEDFPEDHLHHRGIFWAWHQLYLDGNSLADPWECKNTSWDVQETKVKAEGNSGILHANIQWQLGREEAVMQENLILEYTTHAGYYTLDFRIILTSLKDNLELGGSDDIKGYGGFSPRFKLGDEISFFNASGNVQAKNTMVPGGQWMGISGIGEDKTTAIIMYHPKSSGDLKGWILRYKNSMQNAVWPGRTRHLFHLDHSVNLRVRIVVFDESPAISQIQHIYNQYVNR